MEAVAAVEPEKPKVKKTAKKVVIVGAPIIHKPK
jgi:hypothetical protein